MMDRYRLDEPNRMADEVYAERVQRLTKQPTNLVWQDQAPVELVDYDESITRGNTYTDSITCMIFPALRIGFILQLISLGLMIFVHIGQNAVAGAAGGSPWTFDVFNVKDSLRESATFTFSICCLLFIYGAGIGALIIFQSFMTDNGKYSRGFRAGSKLLNTALLMDMLTLCVRLISFVYTHHFIEHRWWIHYGQTRSDYVLFHFGHFVHGISLVFYGLAIFYMEGYHDEGTYEEFGWLLMGLFSLAGLFEILMTFTNFGAFFGYIQFVAIAAAVIWSMSFEPLLHYHSGSLHDRTINDSVLVNNYAPIGGEEDSGRRDVPQAFQYASTSPQYIGANNGPAAFHAAAPNPAAYEAAGPAQHW